MPNGTPPRAFSYVRMSSDTQAKGDSKRRQLEKSRDYAARHALRLVEEDELEDIGVSAFRGANQKDGALGKFLSAVNEGRIEAGSFLLIESLDRLTRQQVMEALGLFLSIVQAGIVIVTLNDGQVYRKETTDLPELMMSLLVMSRAHEESRTKSQRVAAAWKNKRSQASTRPMTKMCPAWLRLSSDRLSYEPIPDRVEVVRSIFQDAANGIGFYSIARRLNQEKVRPFNESDGWHVSYISKILNNRSVLGEFQPHTRVEGRRKPEGEPIKRYFPAIVDEEVFYKAKAGRTARLVTGRGRKGKNVSNLFSSLLTCAYCRGPVKFENKGAPPKGGQYLVCDRARRHLGCVGTRWRYDDFEKSFLAFVTEVELPSLLGGSTANNAAQKLDSEIAALQGRIDETRSSMERAFQLLQTGAAIEFVSLKLKEAEVALVEQEAELLAKQKKAEEIKSTRDGFEESRDEIKSLLPQIQAHKGANSYALRSMVSSRLRQLIDFILTAPAGEAPKMLATVAELKAKAGSDWDDVVRHLLDSADLELNSRPYFSVGFKDGSVRVVTPNRDNPFEYRQQIVSKSGELTLRIPEGELTLHQTLPASRSDDTTPT